MTLTRRVVHLPVGPLAAALAGVLTAAAPAAPAILVVTTTADEIAPDAACALREAMGAANGIPPNADCGAADAGLDSIVFDIAGAASTVHVITLTADLPNITQPVTIDGYSQKAGAAGGASPNTLASGSNAALRIRILAQNRLCLTFLDGSQGSTVRGLNLAQCATSGITINTDEVTVAGNFIGTSVTGLTAGPGSAQFGVAIGASPGTSASRNTIGGESPADRNVISANGSGGISVDAGGGTTDGNRILGNLIGTTALGSAALGNGGAGVLLDENPSGTEIGGPGGTTPGGPCTGACNVIAASTGAGVSAGTGAGTLVQGNFIGTNAAGTSAFGNSAAGVQIGPAAAGSPAVIGGATPSHRNVISGNGQGVSVGTPGGTVSPLIQGNFIGTDATGTAALPNVVGMNISGVPGVTVGGAEPGLGNLVSGNGGLGIVLNNAGSSLIQGNRIGTQADGLSPLGNDAAGVRLAGAATVGSTVGAATSGGPGGNTIAFNGQQGVVIAAQTANRVLGNAIFGNTGRAIELGALGAEVIDPCDPDGGANNGQNPPTLTQALALPGGVLVTGSLTSTPAQPFTLEFFRNPAGDGAQARTFLGSVTVTPGGPAACQAAFEAGFSTPGAAGDTITATATSAGGDTSEVSAPVTAVLQPLIIDGPRGTPNPVGTLEVAQLEVGVAPVVTAPTFAWSADCPGGAGSGVFSDPGAAAPSWQAPRVGTRGPAGECRIEVIVGDGFGGFETASYAQVVQPPRRSARLAGPATPAGSRGSPVALAPGPRDLPGPGPARREPVAVAPVPGWNALMLGDASPPRVDGMGAGRSAARPGTPGSDPGVRVAACDLDGDGEPEVLTAPRPGGVPALRRWRIEAGDSRPLVLRLDALLATAEADIFVACGDLDGTGPVVLTSTADAAGASLLRLYRWRGAAIEPLAAVVDPGPAAGGVPVALADLDGDGRAEVVLGAAPGSPAVVRILGGPALRGGLWREQVRWTAEGADPGTAVHVAGGDLDGDGRAELAVLIIVDGRPLVRVLDGATLADRTAELVYDPGAMEGVALPEDVAAP